MQDQPPRILRRYLSAWLCIWLFSCGTATSTNTAKPPALTPLELPDEHTALVTKLTNGEHKEWYLENTRATLAGKKCIDGEEYYFSRKDSLVIHRYCDPAKKVWQQSDGSWTLQKGAAGSWEIRIGPKVYTLLLLEDDEGEKLILRTVATTKQEYTVDRIFRSKKS